MMKKVLIISKKVLINLYRVGLEHYSNIHEDIFIDIYCLDEPKNLGFLKK